MEDINGAKKYDEDKSIMGELLKFKGFGAVSAVLTFGAKKYGRSNWTKLHAQDRLLDAAIGHMYSHVQGEEFDKESGLPHIAHAVCSLLFLLEHSEKRYDRNLIGDNHEIH